MFGAFVAIVGLVIQSYSSYKSSRASAAVERKLDEERRLMNEQAAINDKIAESRLRTSLQEERILADANSGRLLYGASSTRQSAVIAALGYNPFNTGDK